ncbi:MAG: MerR family transcriptional regulator [Candidatus Cloacimonetes bacterium]|nr:MerR family transcriptional regulator [Candidatus Cloacimonadota bacterium]
MITEKKYYLIGETAKKLSIHDQTIRNYERNNLIKPERTENGIRLFTKENINTITNIILLTQELGLNLSGVKIVFALAKKNKITNDELYDFILDHKNEFLK